MTLGMTGVIWLPRLAEGNSAMLHAGAHAVPLYAATASWGVLTAAWTDAVATIARVVAELSVGLQSPNGVASIARLTSFGVWAEHTATNAGALTAKTGQNAIAYTAAALAMPSPVEIAIAAAAEVAAHSTGGVLNGTAEAAEAYKRSLDIRAALVMEAYEAATTATVLTPADFSMPPPLASGIDFGAGLGKNALTQAVTQATVGAATHVHNAGTAAAQAGEAAGGTASTVSQAGTSAVSSVSGPSQGSAISSAVAPLSGLSGLTANGGAVTRSVSSPEKADTPTLKLPEGWGTPEGGAGTATSTAGAVAAAVPFDSSTRPGPATPPVTSHPARNTGDDEDDRPTPEYLKSSEYFNEGTDISGRAVTPAVIGGNSGADEDD